MANKGIRESNGMTIPFTYDCFQFTNKNIYVIFHLTYFTAFCFFPQIFLLSVQTSYFKTFYIIGSDCRVGREGYTFKFEIYQIK